MNRRKWIRWAALLAFAMVGAGRISAAEGMTGPEAGRKMSVGQTWQYDDGLKVTLLAVRDDSRCPVNARCIWAGDAKIVLLVQAGQQPAKKVVLHTTLKPQVAVIPANILPPGTVGIPKSYVISLGTLSPQPIAGNAILQSDYRLKLRISTAL